MKEQTLPTGSVLRIGEAPFEDALALFDSVMEELRSVGFSTRLEIASMLKEAVFAVSPSKKVRSAIERCMEKSVLNGSRVTMDLWKSGKAKREDYVHVSVAVAEENLHPFSNALLSEFTRISSKIGSSLE